MSRSVSHRLRLIQNLSAPGVSYGNVAANYGDEIYGERATDPVNLLVYVAVPLTSGLGGRHAFRARIGDIYPGDDLAFRPMAFGGPYEAGEGTVLDLSTVDTATLQIDRVSAGPPVTVTDTMTVDDVADTVTSSTLVIAEPGTYRVSVVLVFLSGRSMTLPIHDNRTMLVSGDAL